MNPISSIPNLPLKDLSASQELSQPKGEKGDEELEKSARKFEAFFVGFVFQKAYQSIPKSEEFGRSSEEEMYQSMLIENVTSEIAKSPTGLGLANQIMGKRALTSSAYFSPPTPSLKAPLVDPGDMHFDLPEKRITSVFGLRKDPWTQEARFHSGIDLAFSQGTPIQAAAEGEVVFSGKKGGYGNAVIIKHSQDYTTLYGHAKQNLVHVGQKVSKGEIIAYSGSTGRSTGPHLHFELRKAGKPVDPSQWVKFSKTL